MSNEGTSRHSRTLRIFILLGILLAPFGAVHLQERIFRYRAGHLLSDMRFLVGHQANLPEIQAVFKHWDPHACSEPGCTIEGDSWRTSFSVNRVVNSEDAASDWHPIWLPPLFRTYGGRIAHVEASAGIVGGTMRVISFEVNMEISPSHGVSDYHAGNHLSGSAYSGYPFSIRDDWQGLTLHPATSLAGQTSKPGTHGGQRVRTWHLPRTWRAAM